MDRSDASALADLKMHWDEAYVIGLDGDIWSARYHTSADELRAHTSIELRELIRSDYAYRQKVSRAIDDSNRDDIAELGDAQTGEDDEADQGQEGDEAEDLEGEGDEDTDGDEGDADRAPRREPERVNFAAIREERMST
jgi:hypothetical protein